MQMFIGAEEAAPGNVDELPGVNLEPVIWEVALSHKQRHLFGLLTHENVYVRHGGRQCILKLIAESHVCAITRQSAAAELKKLALNRDEY